MQRVINHTTPKSTHKGLTAFVYKMELEGRTVAVKKPLKGDDYYEHCALLKSEASQMLRLNHPDLLALRAVAYRDDFTWLVFDYFPTDLMEWLKTEDNIASDQQVIIWCDSLLSALCYLHDNGLAHGDCKPENIFLSADNKLVLGDLGNLVYVQGESKYFRTDSNVCSGFYAAPEVMNSKGHRCGCVSRRSDIWEAGIVLTLLIIPNNIPMPAQQAGWSSAIRGLLLNNFPTEVAEWQTTLDIQHSDLEQTNAMPQQERWNSLSPRAFLHALIITCLRIRPAHRPSAKVLQGLVKSYRESTGI
ncbi:protein kinase family protein [Endozoicomonadaceae bacterium StTr2]